MKISVTQKHIDEGRAGSCFSCPIALAVQEAYPGKCHVVVNYRRVRIYTTEITCGHGSKHSFNTTDAMMAFIDDFDRNRSVQPFEADVEFLP